jgi:hypothetical protein
MHGGIKNISIGREKMISTEQRKGKYIYELSILELIEEYKAINVESGNFVMTALKFEMNEQQKNQLNEHCKEFKEYQQEIAKEFIERMIK